ncbi:ferredoxin [Tsukamurella sp. 8F]|uniref:ferredoxin n=1 Tax=unclassified Tsukamurella TaxID=2633480 RepID=UPI0023B93838|nr:MULTISPECIES: ferredoxin [unclassified Tsukamurella]MDF0530739.1 ferredoxin [Tsukamurella sp. 8J]MDF0587940.1 ferredoxin [Tsukamurella sp. 8F]
MKVTIGDMCTGHGVCESIRPDIFEVGDDGYAHVIAEPTEVDRDDVEAAVAGCPTQALGLTD